MIMFLFFDDFFLPIESILDEYSNDSQKYIKEKREIIKKKIKDSETV